MVAMTRREAAVRASAVELEWKASEFCWGPRGGDEGFPLFLFLFDGVGLNLGGDLWLRCLGAGYITGYAELAHNRSSFRRDRFVFRSFGTGKFGPAFI